MAAMTSIAVEMGFDRDEFARLRFLGESAWLTLSLGDLSRAEALFEALGFISPEDPVSFMGLAEVALSRMDADAARQAARNLQSAEYADCSTRALGLALEARACLIVGSPDQAMGLLNRAQELDPDGSGGATARGLIPTVQAMLEKAAAAPERRES